MLARVIRPDALFRFATDVPDYAAWTLERLLRAPDFLWTAERADDWRRPWAGFAGTRYEAKAKREGRTPCYLVFRRTATPRQRDAYRDGSAERSRQKESTRMALGSDRRS